MRAIHAHPARGRRALRLAAALALGTLSAAPVSPKTPEEAGVGVAPFERVAPAGVQLPDVASLLAERLSARGLARVVGPAELGAPAQATPSPEELRGWGSQARVASVVTGRITRLGRRTSLDVRLRSAGTGEALGTYVEEARDASALADAVDRLAVRIAARVGAAAAVGTGPPAGAEPAEPAGQAEPPGIPLRKDVPISIRADELEAFEEGGGRRLLFRRNVRVAQDDVTLEADRLEALYPPGSSEPDLLVATGRVRVAQAELERSMLCREATYFRSEQRVLCEGDAELRQRGDRVQGGQIEIFLDSGRVRVSGGAVVNVRPQGAQAPGSAP